MSMVAQIAEFLGRIAAALERPGPPKEEIKQEPTKSVFTPKEAAKEMLLHPQTVMEWCREGKIAATKLRGKWLIPKKEIDRHLHRYEVINGKKKGGA